MPLKKISCDNNGSVVVETTIAFPLLVMVMAVIISMINIVAVKSHTHYAITQTALDMSQYAYVAKLITNENSTGATNPNGFAWVSTKQNDIAFISDGITSFSQGVAAGITGIFIDDYAAELIRELAGAANEPARQNVMNELTAKIFMIYLCEDLQKSYSGANDYLIRYGVYSPSGLVKGLDGLEFSEANGTASAMIDANGDTVITVSYKIQFNIFNMLPLPLYLDVSQTVKTKAWAGGV